MSDPAMSEIDAAMDRLKRVDDGEPRFIVYERSEFAESRQIMDAFKVARFHVAQRDALPDCWRLCWSETEPGPSNPEREKESEYRGMEH